MPQDRLYPITIRSQAIERCERCDARHRSVCDAVPHAGLARLAGLAQALRVEKFNVFIHEGDAAADFFNITSGTAKLYKTMSDGRQQITGFAGIGHFIGLASSDTYGFSAEAITPLEFCRFARPRLRALRDDLPALERTLLSTACHELVLAQEHMLLLGRKTAVERVASFLVQRLHEAPPCTAGREIISLPMSRLEIADYLGLTIETVSRTISRLKSEGRIATPNRDEITMLDVAWLELIAAGDGPSVLA